MSTKEKVIQFHSRLKPVIIQFIKEKQACGYKYKTASYILKSLDDFMLSKKLKKMELPKSLVQQWIEKQPNESISYQKNRIGMIRQLARFMVRLSHSAYVLPNRISAKQCDDFTPYIFTKKQIEKLLDAADKLKSNHKVPLRHIVLPELYRVLYSCGLRTSELVNLRVADVDLKQGVLHIKESKFCKDRLVPVAIDVAERLRLYVKKLQENSLEKQTNASYFFPSYGQKGWSASGIYFIFRQMLYQCNIPHGGRGKGPRVHDLRHTFAVHRLVRWYEEGADLNAKLPILVTYLGHQDFTGTQKYLHLTAELFPNIKKRMNKQFGDVIPKWRR